MFKKFYLETLFYFLILYESLRNKLDIRNEILSKDILEFTRYFKKKKQKKQKKKKKSNKLIFTDIFKVPHHLYITNCLTNYLSEKYDYEVSTYNTKPRKSFDKVYKALNINHRIISLNEENIKISKKIFIKFFTSNPSKKKLINFKLKNVNIGIDIYESILKSGKPTVSFGKISTYFYFFLGLKYFLYFKKLFDQKKISACFLSHDCYIQCGILSRLATKNKIPLFYANERTITFSENDFDNYWLFKRYKIYFRNYVKNKKHALKLAKNDLKKRLSGKVGIKMSYQTKSAFTNNQVPKQILNTKNKKILIAPNCFYDNPHAYGKMKFPDFWEWLTYIKVVANKSNHDWYIKPHRDYLPNTVEHIREIIKDSKITLIDSETSFYQLKDEGIEYVVTCFGTVGHELPLLGFTVINFGYNPQINYNFNYHCLSKKRFKELILKNLRPKKININEIYEFFYIHKYFLHDDTFFFKSYENYKKILDNNIMNDKAYNYLIKNDKYLEKKMKKNFEKFLKLKNKYSIENRLSKKFFNQVEINFN